MDIFLEFVNTSIEKYGLIAIFLLMISNGFLSIPPSEIILAVAGIFAATTKHTLIQTLCVSIVGNFIGTYIWYYIGKQAGYKWVINIKNKIEKREILKRYLSLMPDETVFPILSNKINENGAFWIGVFRCFPMIRSIVSLPAGMIHMPQMGFILFSMIGISIWAAFWQGLGYLLINNWRVIGFPVTILLSFLLILALYYFNRQIKKFLSQEYRLGNKQCATSETKQSQDSKINNF